MPMDHLGRVASCSLEPTLRLCESSIILCRFRIAGSCAEHAAPERWLLEASQHRGFAKGEVREEARV